MAGRRVDEDPENVFQIPGRISSTWGGGLVDMVRATRILEVIERDGLVDHAATVGQKMLSALEDLALESARESNGLLSNARGSGLLCAIDLPTTADRDSVVHRLREEEHVIALPCGETSVRFRPPLVVNVEEVTEAVNALGRVAKSLEKS
jgi:L-lysine 6-transaminase